MKKRNEPSENKTVMGAGKPEDPFKLRSGKTVETERDTLVHKIREGVRCDTERRGHATPENRPPERLVLDATEGFIPLWEKDTILRWRFRERSLQSFENPDAVKAAIESVLSDAILAWGDAVPVKFSKNNDVWDFEIIARHADDCDDDGCVLASAYFPDPGRHQLTIYPKMFQQDRAEQVATLAHELGHVFGLRHFFAQVSENAWPSVIWGTHGKFSIMNYGSESQLTQADKADLKKLYDLVWSGKLAKINGTPIRLVRPYHTIGETVERLAAFEAMRHSIIPPK